MNEIDDRMFAFKTIDEVITDMDNAIANAMQWWINERFHSGQAVHTWRTWLQFAEDCAQIKQWLKELKELKARIK